MIFIVVIVALPNGIAPLVEAAWRRVVHARGAAGSDRPVVSLCSKPVAAVSTATLEIVGVSKSFGSLKVLEGINLTIVDGELVSLVGPNGAGKTTLMRCVSDGRERSGGLVRVETAMISRPCRRFALPRSVLVENSRRRASSKASPSQNACGLRVRCTISRHSCVRSSDWRCPRRGGAACYRCHWPCGAAVARSTLPVAWPEASAPACHFAAADRKRNVVDDEQIAVTARQIRHIKRWRRRRRARAASGIARPQVNVAHDLGANDIGHRAVKNDLPLMQYNDVGRDLTHKIEIVLDQG